MVRGHLKSVIIPPTVNSSSSSSSSPCSDHSKKGQRDEHSRFFFRQTAPPLTSRNLIRHRRHRSLIVRLPDLLLERSVLFVLCIFLSRRLDRVFFRLSGKGILVRRYGVDNILTVSDLLNEIFEDLLPEQTVLIDVDHFAVARVQVLPSL